MGHHHIRVTFDNRDHPRLGDLVLGQINAERAAAFIEQRGFRAVQILGLVVAARHDAAAEADDPGLIVADGKHHAISERVVKPGSTFAWLDQATQGKLPGREFLNGSAQKAVPRIRRETDVESLDGFVGESARLKIIARRLSGGRSKLFFKEQARRQLGVAQYLHFAGAFAAATIVRNRNSCRLGKLPQRVLEFQPISFHHEIDDVAAFFASEAMKYLFGRSDVKRRSFFLVKWT